MSSYIEAPVTVDPDSLATIAFDTIQGVFPGWEPNAGNLETILVESVARIAAPMSPMVIGKNPKPVRMALHPSTF